MSKVRKELIDKALSLVFSRTYFTYVGRLSRGKVVRDVGMKIVNAIPDDISKAEAISSCYSVLISIVISTLEELDEETIDSFVELFGE